MTNQGKNYIVIIFSVIFVALVIALTSYYISKNTNQILPTPGSNSPQQNTQGTAPQPAPSIDQLKSDNAFPAVASSTAISAANLDPTLNFLILKNASNVVIESDIYSDQTQGYTMTYTTSEDTTDAAQSFIDMFKANNFSIVGAFRNTTLVYTVAENGNYKVQATVEGNKVTVKIQKIAVQ